MATIQRLLAQNPMELIWPVIVFAATFAIGWVVRWVVLRMLRSWNSRSQSRGGQILTEALQGHVLIWTVILGLHAAIQTSDLPVVFTERGSRVLFVLWMVSVTMMFTRVGGNLVRLYGAQVPGALPVTTLSQNLVQIAVVILGAMGIAAHLGVSITPYVAALGVGGIAVALALQDTLSNLFAGFYVAVARQVRPGDYIKLNTGEEGYVSDITWRTTAIRALSNNLILIPNAKLAQANVTNYHLPEKRMGISVQVNVSYDSDLERVERILLDVAQRGAREIPGMLNDPPPSVTFDPGFGDWAMSFTVGFQIAEFSQQFSVRNDLRKRIALRLREEGIQIPYPTRTLRWEGAAPQADR